MAVTTELERHQEDWHNFVRFLAYTSAGIALILILMAIFLV